MTSREKGMSWTGRPSNPLRSSASTSRCITYESYLDSRQCLLPSSRAPPAVSTHYRRLTDRSNPSTAVHVPLTIDRDDDLCSTPSWLKLESYLLTASKEWIHAGSKPSRYPGPLHSNQRAVIEFVAAHHQPTNKMPHDKAWMLLLGGYFKHLQHGHESLPHVAFLIV